MTVMKDYSPGQFCWVDLNAKDYDAMAEWYKKLWDARDRHHADGPLRHFHA